MDGQSILLRPTIKPTIGDKNIPTHNIIALFYSGHALNLLSLKEKVSFSEGFNFLVLSSFF
jgi:hypothetical protein